MDNPLLLLVIWGVINVMIKRTKTLKKIEQAKVKRAQQLESQTAQNINTQPIQNINTQTLQKATPKSNQNKNKSIIDIFKDEIEKEIQREKQRKPSSTVQNKPIKQQQKINNKNTVNEMAKEKEVSIRDEYFSSNTDIDFNKSSDEIKTSYRTSSINIRKDLLNGIIFSEILSEPKSMQNIKRGM